MNPSDLDWRYIRRYTVVPVVTALIACGALGAAIWMHGNEQHQFEQVSINQDVLHQDYDALVYRRRLVDRYHRRYERFSDLGFVGQESRLDWIETMRETTTGLTLPRVSYAIEPQLNVIAPVESFNAGEEAEIHVSRLQLEMGLVHEIDLLRFFDELQQNAPGLIKVERCALTWQADPATALTAGANILADCALSIFSMVTSDVSNEVPTT